MWLSAAAAAAERKTMTTLVTVTQLGKKWVKRCLLKV